MGTLIIDRNQDTTGIAAGGPVADGLVATPKLAGHNPATAFPKACAGAGARVQAASWMQAEKRADESRSERTYVLPVRVEGHPQRDGGAIAGGLSPMVRDTRGSRPWRDRT